MDLTLLVGSMKNIIYQVRIAALLLTPIASIGWIVWLGVYIAGYRIESIDPELHSVLVLGMFAALLGAGASLIDCVVSKVAIGQVSWVVALFGVLNAIGFIGSVCALFSAF